MHAISGLLRNLHADIASRLRSLTAYLVQIAAQRKEHESRASDLAAEQVKVTRLNDEVNKRDTDLLNALKIKVAIKRFGTAEF